MEINTVGITGIVVSQPEKRNNLYGRLGIYRLWVDVERDSGTIDRILVLLQEGETETEETVTTTLYPVEYWQPPEVIIEKKAGKLTAEEIIKGFQPGSTVEVTGRVQTYKDKETGRTQLFVWGLYLAAVPKNSQQINIAYIKGTVAKQPVYRETPKGKHITDITVRIPSAFTPGFYSYIPCITWEKLAEQAAGLREGSEVYLEGRIQSRPYTKKTPEGVQEFTTWEVSASREGSEVYLEGRIQSRPYTKKTPEGVQEFTTWEVSASKLEETETEGE